VARNTVGQNAFLMAEFRREMDELKGLFMEALRQILLISQVQAENTRQITDLVRSVVTVPTASGPGTSRSMTEEEELQAWRAQVRELATGEKPPVTIGSSTDDPVNDW
jgi:hypothetical protein